MVQSVKIEIDAQSRHAELMSFIGKTILIYPGNQENTYCYNRTLT